MAKFKMQIDLKTESGTSSSNQEVEIPEKLVPKVTNSSFKNEIIPYIENSLPQMINGVDWQKRGWKVVSFNNVRKA
jgi:hypothetical protein